MATQYRCKNRKRLKDIIGKAGFNGIDYLEVSADQKTLRVYCVNNVKLPDKSTATITGGVTDEERERDDAERSYAGTAIITGGVRVRGATVDEASLGGGRVVSDGDLRVTKVTASGKVITLTVNQPGDFSPYTLRLIDSPTNLQPPGDFDRQLSEVVFSFKVDCPGEFDCKQENVCPSEPLPEPEINYLAKDYASFRRLLLDRLSAILPSWRERNPADVEVMLVELLAYVGDHLSYYQDAVATEAYLGTARQRISVRRHARLLDYLMHDGCNARAWVCFDYRGAVPLALPEGTRLLTRGPVETPLVAPENLERVLTGEQPAVFETLHPVSLEAARNTIQFYTWQDESCCLPRGATRATLRARPDPDDDPDLPDLKLRKGDLLAFEEVVSPKTGTTQDADPAHRHVVRLTAVKSVNDTLPDPDVKLIEVTWAAADALPFPLCLSAEMNQDKKLTNVSVAHGNVVLADHGLSISKEELDQVPDGGSYRPKLKRSPLTQQGRVRDTTKKDELVVFDPKAPASVVVPQRWNLRNVQSCIRLQDGNETWKPQRDLLGSERFAREFVVEVERDGVAYLRFGDGVLGQRPAAKTRFTAHYRVGNGAAGNVGTDAITRVVSNIAGITRVWNPLPAVGGVEPEAMEQVRQFAPQAFRVQERAVTPADYVEVTQRRADVQRAAAQYRWTGSWYTAFVTVDRIGGQPVDAGFEGELRAYLNQYRLAGYDLEINGPIPVSLDLVLFICVKPDHFRSDVKRALLRVFSNRTLPDGRRGFFHPDNFTFGQPLYLSRIYEAALAVDGVASVQVQKFQRWGNKRPQAVVNDPMTVGPYEIIRLDNDRNFPENGKIDFVMGGGL